MNMIASVLYLDRKSVKALRITDAYSLHRVVYSLYEDVRDVSQKKQSRASGILYADQGGDYRGRKILMLSDRAPMAMVEGQYGEVNSRPVPDGFLTHKEYRFKIIVNPTRRNSASRNLVPVRGREAITQWFAERAINSWGFEALLPHLQVDNVDVLTFSDKEQRVITIAQTHLKGVLRVTEPAVFADSFRLGVGRARAYGCGLLQIVPNVDSIFS